MRVFIRIFSKKKMFWQYLRIVTGEYSFLKNNFVGCLTKKFTPLTNRHLNNLEDITQLKRQNFA